MPVGGRLSPFLNGIARIVVGLMLSIGQSVPHVRRDARKTPMSAKFGDDEGFHFFFHPFCQKCGRYYSGKSPHICFPDDLSVEDERRKLRKWLGEGYKTIE